MYVLCIFLPLVAAFIAGMFGRFIGDRGAQYVTCGALIVSALIAPFMLYDVAVLGHARDVVLTTWIASGDLELSWALRFDSLSAVMVFVVTVISALIHVYSVGYMDHDPHKPRFMAYLSLFTFSMLMLVTADNLIQMFFGWEGVGLCSYLLIGFWYHKPSANDAAIKAFIVNRIGDFGFALGIFGTFLLFQSVSFTDVFAAVPGKANATLHFLNWDFHALTVLCLLLFIGAMGKSAQLGLHTWLPDAMEGPTPVSALIHAATMVTAGVFMVCRLSPMFEYAPAALNVVCIVGAATAFFAATVGLVQNDIKRVIAYSTCSQLGYMFFAAGVSAYGAAMFHLYTHAFFKALLFLGAGSVIHAMSGEQDMRKMGGIWKKVPYTYAVMWIGSLALAGVPFFAGFYSKDMILEAAFAAHSGVGLFAYAMGTLAAFMTAFYSWRLLLMTFHGSPRADHHTMEHVHESPLGHADPAVRAGGGRDVRRVSWATTPSSARGGPIFGARRSWCCRRTIRSKPRITSRCGSSCCRWAWRWRASRWLMSCTCCGRAGRRLWPRGSAGFICSCSTSGTSTSCTGTCWSSRRCALAASYGRAATARSSTALAPTASPARPRSWRAAPGCCRPAISITTPSRC